MKLGIFFILIGILGMMHQRLFTSGGWFNWSQFWHHEPLIAISIVIGLTILIMWLAQSHNLTNRRRYGVHFFKRD